VDWNGFISTEGRQSLIELKFIKYIFVGNMLKCGDCVSKEIMKCVQGKERNIGRSGFKTGILVNMEQTKWA
jgi:hypothetical protein